ncbi:N-acetyl-gamma-glutamyl-phosphate reductase [Flavilitoribacter nigricans]|uniref:N-acetyl-gamma-glutamyl-phosphate reductase n=1 Tax=Flavilitoribacter nigricans (strain ATCC 23147 / DSM 23189 / NBRC 102662 / NCIMB 1420 / SS-2) TaxID=1122177 RepID=A0A2D0NAX1_FLAN2|nr:N-acetyl-gamma-glutamyl-phosphate reductase [Flavilitoribacter nigricans]PHN05661.1 N-acetyl-gamma-glutamyl-phosphate reductase [Flavilitoribacter nigricans DSM 23189 = NBRC 102662]
MIQAGIIGGGGYTAGELIRILTYHPEVELAFVHSKSQAGNPIHSIHTDLLGEVNLDFTDTVDFGVDVIFLCMGHGQSKTFLESHEIPEELVVIDLSHDYRLNPDFIYGLPEMNREEIRKSRRIANCGCFATAIQLGLLPLAKAGLLQDEVHVTAITGSTGAGQSPGATTHFSWRNNNISVYKAFKHQHLAEILRSLTQLQPDFTDKVNFIPVRGDFARGIFASIYTDCALSGSELQALYEEYYQDAPFTIVTEQNPNVKQVVNTNKCIVHVEEHDGKAFIISTIDNLLKGASGQAVENMNLVFGFPQTAGLQLKASVF